jgi:hypothetical protein
MEYLQTFLLWSDALEQFEVISEDNNEELWAPTSNALNFCLCNQLLICKVYLWTLM